ncbi:transketolase, partial [Candidatus Pacearchaeota archaeon]|nr:transketolase [Candidatus Pacearchaeota archaeon]
GMSQVDIEPPEPVGEKVKMSELAFPSYKLGDEIATREAYGKALASLCKSNSLVLALDAEVSNSTFAEEVKKKTPGQFIESYIAEQNMIGMALGLSKKTFNVFASTFAAFLSRAHDQLRMASYSYGDFTVCGSHAGVSIGEDGASQMGLEDIAIFRSLPHTIILYPSDAVSTQKLLLLSQTEKGMKYIRTTRSKTPVIYADDYEFEIGDFGTLRESKNDKIVLAGAGITLHEALKAHEMLNEEKISSAVVDIYCIKPFNAEAFIEFVKGHGNKIIIAEDHYKEGGIGEMLCHELANSGIKIQTLAVSEMPHSGTKDELLEKYGINDSAILEAARNLVL